MEDFAAEENSSEHTYFLPSTLSTYLSFRSYNTEKTSSETMESSQIWGFFNILSQSLKLVVRNAILIALISTLSILLTSIIFFLFSFSYEIATKFLMSSMMNDSGFTSGVLFIIFVALILAVNFIFMFSYIAVAHALGFATVTATAASYTDGGRLSLPDVFSRIRTKWRSPFRFRKNNIRGVRKNPMHFLLMLAVTMVVPLVMLYPNPVTIAVAVTVGVSISIFYLYASVGSELVAVVLIVEEGCEAAEAVVKAEKLVEGSRLQGFMVNVSVSIVGLIVLLGLWMIVGDRESLGLNISVYALVFLNCATVMRIFGSVAYTVYYFRCKEYHAHNIQRLALVDDIA